MIDKKDLENLDYHSKNFILNRNLYLTENTLIGIIDESLRDEVMWFEIHFCFSLFQGSKWKHLVGWA